MDDPAYKSLSSRPRMVRDLLRGIAPRDWRAEFDLLDRYAAEAG